MVRNSSPTDSHVDVMGVVKRRDVADLRIPFRLTPPYGPAWTVREEGWTIIGSIADGDEPARTRGCWRSPIHHPIEVSRQGTDLAMGQPVDIEHPWLSDVKR